MKIFLESSLSTDKAGSFYHPIQRSRLKTFEDMNPKVQLKCKSRQVVKGHLNPELVLRRALSLTKCRDDVSVKTVLSYPICPIPTALFHDDGTMRKTNKSDLAHELENLVGSVPNIPPFDHSATVLMRDGMSLVQSFDVKRMSTFGDLAKSYIMQQLNIRGRIIVKCSDTEVLVLCVHYFKVLVSTEQMWFLTGSTDSLRDCRRYIPIHELSKSLSPLVANILPAVHALTGCDTTSAIFGFGKKTVFKLITKSPSKFTNLQNFDKIDFPTSLSEARELISSLYDPKDKFASSHVDLNKLRVKLATCKDTISAGSPSNCTDASFIDCKDTHVCSNTDLKKYCPLTCGICTQVNGCYYKGKMYQQDEHFDDGCLYKCVCEDTSTGRYVCREKCYTWNLPSVCTLNPPAAGKCCQTPSCPPYVQITYPQGYSED
ncbi:unnamed protein product [Mytilus coruscus]|uniref:VWFC domain-containing protein n=1 Tax=Mytilus coruscus TaxID=42192 RepID=A0A6J8CB22_MYTCO|nr:unnamed protein product [Mytilus coruscus]